MARMDGEANVLLKEESYRIMGAYFEVHNQKGCGFSEAMYHECLDIEFGIQGIPAISKPRLEQDYKGRKLTQRFEPDFVCFGKIVVELKALPKLTEEHRAQVMNYVKATRFDLGILANFGSHPRLESMRIVPHRTWDPQTTPDLRS